MSSLVGSIFGANANEEKPAGLSNIFEESVALPEKPQHRPIPPRKKKRKEAPVEEEQGQLDGTKNRKQRKPPQERETAAAAEEPEADSAKDATQEDSVKDNAEERTVFVGNLPIDTTRKSLACMFKSCGKVESCRLRSVAAAGVKLPTDRAGDQVRVHDLSVYARHNHYSFSYNKMIHYFTTELGQESLCQYEQT